MSAHDQRYIRAATRGVRPYVDVYGTTNPTANTQSLFAHGLRDDVGRAVAPSFVTITSGTALAAPAAPAPTTATTGGTVAAGTYQVVVTYVGAQGESLGSAAGPITTTGTTSTITVPSPAALSGATGWYAYVSQAGGAAATATRQQAAGSPTAIGTALTLTAPPTSTGATAPANAVCYVVASNNTSTQIDVRSTGGNAPFQARCWL